MKVQNFLKTVKIFHENFSIFNSKLRGIVINKHGVFTHLSLVREIPKTLFFIQFFLQKIVVSRD